MDFPIIINWLSPLSFLGESGVVLNFSMNFLQANKIAPDWMQHSAASHLGLYCLPMSQKEDARVIWVKTSGKSFALDS